MMSWVLILWITTANGGAAIDHIEFADQKSCEAAITALPANSWLDSPIKAKCVHRPLPPLFGAKP